MKPDAEDESKKDGSLSLDSRFNQTLKSVQGLLSGRSFPGRVLLSRRTETTVESLQVANPASTSDQLDRDSDATTDSSDGTNYVKVENPGPNVTESSLERSGSSASSVSENATKGTASSQMLRLSSGGRATDGARIAKFRKELSAPIVDLDSLREIAWSGVPSDMRPLVWRLLLGYAPPNSDRREVALMRKRLEYVDCVSQYYDIPNADRAEDEMHTLRQISVDCPRTVPDVAFFHQPVIQACLERILYIWAIRHPASGYVQEPVSKHMERQGLEFLQFAFRWVNCLLIREIPFLLVTRLWDTYLAEGDKFPDFLVYACASFLLTWTEQLQRLDFQEMVLFLQHLPTRRWTHQELEMVLSRAFMWRVMFDRAPSHLNCN